MHNNHVAHCLILVISAYSIASSQNPPSLSVGLRIDTDPPGASVEFDKKRLGLTPLMIPDVSLRTHTVLIRKRGYIEIEETINVEPNHPPITYTLERAGLLYVNSTPDNARVEINGAIVGETPLNPWPLRAGSHTVRIMKPGYPDAEKEIVIIEGKGIRLAANLASRPPLTESAVPESQIVAYLQETEDAAPSPSRPGMSGSPGESVQKSTAVTGNIHVIVEPPEARDAAIYVGTEYTAAAPTILTLLKGEYTITAKKLDFIDATERVSLKENQQLQLVLRMTSVQVPVMTAESGGSTMKWIGLVATLVAGGAATYFYMEVDKNYSSYQVATTSQEAISLREKTKKNDLYFRVSVSAAGLGILTTMISWISE